MLFRKKKTRREDDRVWATEALKFKGVSDDIIDAAGAGLPVLVIGHFKDTMQNLTETMASRGIEFDTVLDRWQMARYDLWSLPTSKVLVFLSEVLLEGARVISRPGKREIGTKRLHAIAVEHYPIQRRDRLILDFMETLPPGSSIRFHSALDEPLLVAFGADRTLALLSKLGWEKTGYMENATITRAISSGQTRIEKVATSDDRVNSQKEWFYYNCPSLKDRMR